MAHTSVLRDTRAKKQSLSTKHEMRYNRRNKSVLADSHKAPCFCSLARSYFDSSMLVKFSSTVFPSISTSFI